MKKEVEDIFVTRTDEKTLEHLIKIKEENRDIQNILNWVEEFSNLNQNQKEILTSLKNKNLTSSTPKSNQPSKFVFKEISSSNILINHKKENQSIYDSNFFLNYSLKNGNTDDKTINDIISSYEYCSYSQIKNHNNFLNINESLIKKIDSPSFNIFEFEKSVGQQHTLSTISYFIFSSLGLYSIIDYSNFENFLDQIAKGYNRKNPYHTDLHSADVEQTCFIYLKYGLLKEVFKGLYY